MEPNWVNSKPDDMMLVKVSFVISPPNRFASREAYKCT